jgi:hypothetical protein
MFEIIVKWSNLRMLLKLFKMYWLIIKNAIITCRVIWLAPLLKDLRDFRVFLCWCYEWFCIAALSDEKIKRITNS